MKAIFYTQYGGPKVLQVKDVEINKPKENEVLLKNYASSITTADTFIRRGEPKFGRLFLGLTKPKNTMVGTGFAGEIVQVGKKVDDFKVGDKVYGETTFGFGANAEYVCVDVTNNIIEHLPKELSYEEAAPICDGALTSYNFLVSMAKLKPNQHVLINGASGALGTAAIQIAKNIGAKVTTVCSSKNIDLVKRLGADEAIDYNQVDFTKNLNCYDVIYDTIGSSTFSKSKKSLKSNGQFLSPVLSLSLLSTMIWTSIFGNKKAKFEATGLKKTEELSGFLQQIHLIINQSKLKTVIDKMYAIEEIADAHEYIDFGRKKGNVILRLNQ